jgi:hypothetical protein
MTLVDASSREDENDDDDEEEEEENEVDNNGLERFSPSPSLSATSMRYR